MCNSCEALTINGVLCHETGCPDSWMDYSVECYNCGTEFIPTESGQTCCDDECNMSYWGGM